MTHAPAMNWEIHWMIALQQALSPGLDGLMRVLSHMGDEALYIGLIPFIYWCLSRDAALRLLLLIVVSSFVNGLLKWGFHSPRPYWWSADIAPLSHENSFCPPSGHSQNAVVFWLLMADSLVRRYARAWIWAPFLALAFLISFSRVYLGVHFPHSVLLGWVAGAVFLLATLRYGGAIADWYLNRAPGLQAALALAIPGALLGIMGLLHLALADFVLAPEWIENAARIMTPDERLEPFEVKPYFGYAGSLAGLLLGASLANRSARFSPEGPWLIRIFRYAFGTAGVLLILYGSKAAGIDETTAGGLAFRFLRYFAAILWAVWLWPLLFLRVGLARRADPAT